MLQGRSIFARGIVLAGVLAATVAAGGPVFAQNGRIRVAIQKRREAAAAAQGQALKPNVNPEGKAAPNVRGMEGLPPKWVENLRDMPPAEQEQFMQNDERFKNLPPQRQQQIRQNLQKWNSLTPEQQQTARNNAAALQRMTPEQRQYVRNTLLPRWQALPTPRRQAINRHLAMLSNMSPDTQQAALNDQKFLEGLNPDEQQMLRDLNSLRNPPPQ